MIPELVNVDRKPTYSCFQRFHPLNKTLDSRDASPTEMTFRWERDQQSMPKNSL